MNEHDDILYPLESEDDAYNRVRWALAYAVAHTHLFYAYDVKERDQHIVFTVLDYRDGDCVETWHDVDVAFVMVMPHPAELQQYFIDLFNGLPRWGDIQGGEVEVE